MSLFGSLMADFDDDPFFGSTMRQMGQMNNMMNSLFSDPLGMMGHPALTNGDHRARQEHQMVPFGFPPMPAFNLNRMFADFNNMAAGSNCHSFTRSVMTMASGPDGRPQVYQETMSTTTAPGGVKETKKTVCDSRTGVKKLAIGHHIGERAHIMEREHNLHSGEQEERQEFINLDEDEAESFNNEWESRARNAGNAVGHSSHGVRKRFAQLALPEPPSDSRNSSSSRWVPSSRRSNRLPPTSKPYSSPHALSSDASGRSKPAGALKPAGTTAPSTTNLAGNRKREHTPDVKVSKKRHAVSDSNV